MADLMAIDPLQLGLSGGVTVVAIASLVVLAVAVRRHWERLSRRQEQDLSSLKKFRIVLYCLLSAVETALSAGLVSQLVQLRTAQERAVVSLQLVQDGSLAAAWGVHAVAMYRSWSYLGAVRLLPSGLLALSAGTGALAADGVGYSQSRQHDPGIEGGVVEQVQVVSLVVHGLLLLLLLALLVVELVVSGHVEAALAVRTAGMTHTLARTRSGRLSASGYHAVPGHDTQTQEELEEAEEAAEEAALVKAAKKADKTRSKGKAPTRVAMARAAFKYALPQGAGLKARLFGCFLLVAAERGVNLAVPLMYKRMVDTLSLVSALNTDSSSAASGGGAVPTNSTATNHLATALHKTLLTLQTSPAPGGVSDGGVSASQSVSLVSLQHGYTLLATMGKLLKVVVPFWHVFLPWVAAYLGCWYLRGGSGMEGLLSSCRDILWTPITQAAYRRVSRDVFGHLLDLDHSFHVKRKTGEIGRILDRGTSAIQDTVSIVLFNVVPQMADIAVACGYLAMAMEPWAAVIVAVTVASYVPLTVIITERRGEVRKRMNALDNAREARATDMLLNWETVKLFTAEQLELEGYDRATRQYQAQEYWQLAFLSLLAIAQGTCVWGGLVAGCVVCVSGVAQGTLTVGDAVLFITMMNQLYVPLTYFGSYYRQVQKAMVDVENMFDLLATKPKVQDLPGAKPLRIAEGALSFDRVVFGYKVAATKDKKNKIGKDSKQKTPTAALAAAAAAVGAFAGDGGAAGGAVGTVTVDIETGQVGVGVHVGGVKDNGGAAGDGAAGGGGLANGKETSTIVLLPVLRGVSFSIPGGSTLAVVGSSGSGKSTLLKLLLRFYDPWSGAVLVDGQDIKYATLASVRRAISVVPQDSVLFNQSIKFNIRYGAPDASDQEVQAAAEVAAIHDTIVSFKKGYDTRVGERGLRLSGGEKQRVAFARAVVKKPAILVLDEATSALDTLTEASIQRSLASLRRSVTTVIVAHRLSTIKDADTIMVLREGQVAEYGSHEDLMRLGGQYAAMWARQKESVLDTIPDTSCAPTPRPTASPPNSAAGSPIHSPEFGSAHGAGGGASRQGSAEADLEVEVAGGGDRLIPDPTSTSGSNRSAGLSVGTVGTGGSSGSGGASTAIAVLAPGGVKPVDTSPMPGGSTALASSLADWEARPQGLSSTVGDAGVPPHAATGGAATAHTPTASQVDLGPFAVASPASSGTAATAVSSPADAGAAAVQLVSRGPSSSQGPKPRSQARVPQRLQMQFSTAGAGTTAAGAAAAAVAAAGSHLAPAPQSPPGMQRGYQSQGSGSGGSASRRRRTGGPDSLREPLLRHQTEVAAAVEALHRRHQQQHGADHEQEDPEELLSPTESTLDLSQLASATDSELVRLRLNPELSGLRLTAGGASELVGQSSEWSAVNDWSRRPTPLKSRTAHDHDEDDAQWRSMSDERTHRLAPHRDASGGSARRGGEVSQDGEGDAEEEEAGGSAETEAESELEEGGK